MKCNVVKVPDLSVFKESQMLALKSSYPANNSRPLLLKETLVIPQMIWSCAYSANSWSALMSNSRHVASSEPVAKACPLGKNWKRKPLVKTILISVFWLDIVKRWRTVTALMSDSCPVKVCLHCPSLMSHSLALASHAPDKKTRLSGKMEMNMTSPVWFANCVTKVLFSISQRPLHNTQTHYELVKRKFWRCSKKVKLIPGHVAAACYDFVVVQKAATW